MSETGRPTLGRPRPPYQPRAIQCARCGAPQRVADERAVQLVCGSCGSRLELSGAEVSLVNAERQAARTFPLALDAPFTWKGHRWRITARMALTEDDDPGNQTRVYYLYSPRRGSLILDEYNGSWTLSRDVHVQPLSDPFAQSPGDRLQTGDGRTWACTDGGVYRVAYVDGALPWIQQQGDLIRYVEFRAIDGSADLFDAEQQGGEVEVALGWALSPDDVRKATGKADLGAVAHPKPSMLVRATDRWPLGSLIALAVLSALFNGALALAQRESGTRLLTQTVSADQLSGEYLTKSFRLDQPDTVLAVDVAAPRLDNAWMAVDFALVAAGDTVLHVDDLDLEYYHGYEDGESWSEGSSSARALFLVPEPGEYQLLLHAVGNAGETESGSRAEVPMNVEIRAGARPDGWAIFAAVASVVVAVLLGIALKSRSGWDDDDDD